METLLWMGRRGTLVAVSSQTNVAPGVEIDVTLIDILLPAENHLLG